jgi:hypothetical protein
MARKIPMIAGMSEVATVDQLRVQANEIAANNPPLRVLDTVILAVCFSLGWVFGIVWRYPLGYIAFMGLTIRHGYRKANPPKPKAPEPADPSASKSQKTIYAAGGAVAYTEP